MKGEINLWNLVKNKTRIVIEYIENLEPLDGFDTRENEVFEFRKKYSLKGDSANEMLRRIVYSPIKLDGIFYIKRKMVGK